MGPCSPASSCCWCWSITSRWSGKTSGLAFGPPPSRSRRPRCSACRKLLEKMMPFCILIGAMTLAIWRFSARRLEPRGRAPRRGCVCLAVHRGRRWQARVVLGILATTAYNPISRPNLRELSKTDGRRSCFGSAPREAAYRTHPASGINQVNSDGNAIINAARSEQQGVRLDRADRISDSIPTIGSRKRIGSAPRATPRGGDAGCSNRAPPVTPLDGPPVDQDKLLPCDQPYAGPGPPIASRHRRLCLFFLATPKLTSRSSESSGFATAGYRLQYHKLSRPAISASLPWFMLAAAVSLRFLPFRRHPKDGF